MKLYCVEVLHPKSGARQRNQYVEQVVLQADSPDDATKRYQKHLDDLEADFSPRVKGRYKLLRAFEYKGWFVSRGLWKYDGKS